MKSADVTQHNFFVLEAKLCQQRNMEEKSTFGELPLEESQIINNVVPVMKKKHNVWDEII